MDTNTLADSEEQDLASSPGLQHHGKKGGEPGLKKSTGGRFGNSP